MHLTNLARLELHTAGVSWAPGCLLMSVVGQLTTLRCLRLPTLADWPSPSPLSTLRYSTLSSTPSQQLAYRHDDPAASPKLMC